MRKILLLTALVSLFSISTAAAQDYGRNEISVSYGTVSHTQITNLFVELITLSFAEVDIRFTGTMTAEYLRYVSRGIALGGTFVYEFGREPQGADFKCRSHYMSLMPTAKFFWFNKEHVGMYSRLALGATYMHGVAEGDKLWKVRPAFQLSAICLEAGGKVRGYFELGYGTQGLALAGVKVRF